MGNNYKVSGIKLQPMIATLVLFTAGRSIAGELRGEDMAQVKIMHTIAGEAAKDG